MVCSQKKGLGYRCDEANRATVLLPHPKDAISVILCEDWKKSFLQESQMEQRDSSEVKL
jgi:hypothetical protein